MEHQQRLSVHLMLEHRNCATSYRWNSSHRWIHHDDASTVSRRLTSAKAQPQKRTSASTT
ncbi:hypothetical protein BJY01DRAFT_203309 [Aspergillus pseudoustus]|uniref:Uncharacterized protein n=1 Tax=Aspergillus pseudoustus TaxID=1810923 RepID=A0ABR4KWS3_9EURO